MYISSPTATYGTSPSLQQTMHPFLILLARTPLTSKLAPTMTLGLGITTVMFIFTYLPQMAVMAFTSGPLAAVSAALLVLSESSTLFTMLSKTFLIEDALVDTFDGVLVSKNTTSLVSEGRQIKSGSGIMGKLGKLTKTPFQKFTPNALIRYLMYLPLNFIPVVGTVMFVILQGKRAGPTAHTRYFQLKQWNSSQKQKHIDQYKAAYTGYLLSPCFQIIYADTSQLRCGGCSSRTGACCKHTVCFHKYCRGGVVGSRYGEGECNCQWNRARTTREGRKVGMMKRLLLGDCTLPAV